MESLKANEAASRRGFAHWLGKQGLEVEAEHLQRRLTSAKECFARMVSLRSRLGNTDKVAY